MLSPSWGEGALSRRGLSKEGGRPNGFVGCVSNRFRGMPLRVERMANGRQFFICHLLFAI